MSICLFSLLPCICGSAAIDTSGWIHLTADKGLPSNNVYCVIKDKVGRIWFSTDNGVVRYDGYSFKVFNTNDGLPSNDVWRIYEDVKGRVWIFTHSYQWGYLYNDTYHAINLSSEGKLIVPAQIASKGNLTALSYSIMYLPHFSILKDDEIIATYNLHQIQKLETAQWAFLGADFSFWFIYFSNRIRKYAPFNEPSLRSRTCSVKDRLGPHVLLSRRIFSYKNKIFFNSSDRKALDAFDIGSCRFTEEYYDSARNDNRIIIAESIDDCIRLITKNAIYFLDSNLDNIRPIVFFEPFLRNRVTYYYSGLSGQWFTTNGDGVWIKKKYCLLSQKARAVNALAQSKIINYDEEQTYLWDSENEELSIYCGQVCRDRVPLQGMGQPKLVKRINSRELAVSFSNGVFTLNLGTRVLTPFLLKENRPFLVKDYYLNQSHRGGYERLDDSVMRGFFGGSHNIEKISDSEYLYFHTVVNYVVARKDSMIVSKLISEKISGFLYDSINHINIFYNTSSVYYCNNKWNPLLIAPSFLHTLGIKNIRNIILSKNSNYYIHSQDKLVRFNYRSHELQSVPVNFNLSNASSMRWKDYIVFVGNFGLAFSKIDDNGLPGSFKILPNLKDNGYNLVFSTSIDSAGNILVSEDHEMLSLSMDSILNAHNVFQFDSKELMSFYLKSPDTKEIRDHDTLTISQETGKLEIGVTNFYGGAGLHYHYKIEGNWMVSSSGELFLGNLTPGIFYKIKFYVQDEFWNSNVHEVWLYLPLKWYQTVAWKTIFWLCGLIAFSSCILLASILTRRAVAKSNEKRRWQTELELRAVHSQINPHFIFNTLATALFFISKQQSAEAYDHVSRFSKLLRGYLKSSRERLITLSNEIEMLEQYIKLQNARFQTPFRYEINVSPEVSPSRIRIPSLLLQPIVENAINHGIFHKGENGVLIISFKIGTKETELMCTIDDNGVGRTASRLIQRNLKYERESYGSAMTDELIDIFRKYEQMNIRIQYIDKEAPETGTIVNLVIGNIKLVG